MIQVLLWLVPSAAVVYLILLRLLPWESRRKLRHRATIFMGGMGAVVAMIPLLMLLYYLIRAGAPGFSLQLFTQDQKPLGEPGSGLRHAIVGSAIIVGLASAIAVPIGVLAGIYLAEFGRGRLAAAIRFLAEVLTGLPSIIAGILGYALIVARYKNFSGWAGAIALTVLMIPVITRVCEESLRLVPGALREASLSLGIGQWRTICNIILPAAKGGILTGVILAVARVGGETAPLLFTAGGQTGLKLDPGQAMAALPLSIYLNAGQPFDVNRQLAISGALFLVIWIALINLGVRWIASRSRQTA